MLVDAIDRAYKTMRERNWDTIYWAIDLHGVCLKSNYEQGGYQWINDLVLPGLQEIAKRPESRIILWSSAHPEEHGPIVKFFADHGVVVLGFNSNPLVSDTATGCFDEKFYFSILLDDKAGFDPQYDWWMITQYLKNDLHERMLP